MIPMILIQTHPKSTNDVLLVKLWPCRSLEQKTDAE